DIKEHTLNIRNLPVVNNETYAFCEDVAGGGQSLQDITAYNSNITNENLGDVTITWYTNNTLTTPVADETNVSISNNKSYYAQVKFNSTNCYDIAQVDFTVNPQITITAGSDEEICVGETLDLSTITNTPNQTNATALQWATSG